MSRSAIRSKSISGAFPERLHPIAPAMTRRQRQQRGTKELLPVLCGTEGAHVLGDDSDSIDDRASRSPVGGNSGSSTSYPWRSLRSVGHCSEVSSEMKEEKEEDRELPTEGVSRTPAVPGVATSIDDYVGYSPATRVLRQRLAEEEERKEGIQQRLEEAVEEAKERMGLDDRTGAIFAMKRKKMYEAELENVAGRIATLKSRIVACKEMESQMLADGLQITSEDNVAKRRGLKKVLFNKRRWSRLDPSRLCISYSY